MLNWKANQKWNNEKFNLTGIVGEIVAATETEFSSDVQIEAGDSDFVRNLKLFTQGCIAFASFLRSNIDETVTSNAVRFNLDRTKTNTQIIKQGTALLFQMREFITGDSLQFVLGGRTSKGVLKEKTYDQNDIFSGDFSRFRVSFAKGQIELASCIEKLSALEEQHNSLGDQWSKIEKYGFVSDYKSESNLVSESNEEGNEYHIYNKAGPDINVYFNFMTSSRRKTISYYYDTGGGSVGDSIQGMLAYDRGWLYQWLKMYQNVEIDDGSSTPLYPLMTATTSFREKVPGIKGGDYGSEQYKFRNRRVITLKNILDILEGTGREYNGIIPACYQFFTAIDTVGQKEAIKQILLDFTTYNEDEIDRFLNEEAEDLLK